MKIDTIKNGGQSQGGLDSSGGTLTGPLMLSRHPQLPMEAATKQYVDQGVQNLDAGSFTTGTLPIARLPVMGGDVTSEAGSNLMSLVPTGVTPGEYARITVNAKGRAIGTGIISANDLPALPFDKITMDKPTTLSGYGITDAVSNAGGIMTGPLILAGNPTNGDHLVPKQYIDGMVNSLSSARTGDVVRKAYSTTPTGFLKCNGAEVDKNTYADLYAIIGESNNNNSLIGAGQPWRQQYQINNDQSVDFGNWASTGTVPGSFVRTNPVVTKNRVYILGGYNGSSHVATVYTAPINADGSLGSWTTGTSLPSVLNYIPILTIKNRVYLFGGYNGSSYVTTVYTALINADGTLGAWTTSSNLLAPVGLTSVMATKTRVYLMGGYNGSSYVSTVYTAPINSDGTLGAWVADTSLPGNLGNSQVIVTKNRVYLCGGHNGTSAVATVYTAPINVDGTIGTWTTGTSLPITLYTSASVVTSNRVYLIGGYNGSSYSSITYTAPINADGTLGTWVAGASLYAAVDTHAYVVTKNRLHILGGYNGSSYYSTIYTATFSGGLNDYSPYYSEDTTNYIMPGSGQPWRQQYQINSSQGGNITGWATSGSLPIAVHAAQAIVTKNRVYLMGGENSAGSNISSVYTAPINTDGTLGSWTLTTSLPDVLSRSQAVVTKNRVYLIGGYRNSSAVSSVYTAPINADGTLGTWSIGTSLPSNVGFSQAILTKNRVYLIGGSTDGSNVTLSTIYTAPINTDGTLGTWSISPSALPETLGWSHAVVTKNRVYMLGGWRIANGAITTVYTATINSDGYLGPWVITTSLPGAMHWSQVYVAKNIIYLIGGWNNAGVVNSVYFATINADGTLGPWTTGTSLPGNVGVSQLIATQNKLYLLGGRNSSSSVISTIYSASISEGLNDLSPYYDGSIVALEPVNPSTVFKLPDMSATDVNGIYHYIKF